MIMDELSPSKPPPKRSIFNQPSWSNPQQIGTADEFFHRSNQTYVDVAAEAERKRKGREARKQRLLTRSDAIERRAVKRRRVLDDSSDEDDSSSSEYTNQSVARKQDLISIVAESNDVASPNLENSKSSPKSSPKSLSKRYQDTIIAGKVDQSLPHPLNIIDLEDEEERPMVEKGGQKESSDDDIAVTHIKAPNPPIEDDFPVSDDEFAELARKAREKARRKRLEEDLASATPDPPPSIENEYQQRSQSHHQPTPPPPTSDPVVQILITSQIANTEPLIVCRGLSQRLKDVRLAWCQRQGFKPEFIPTVFLTWKSKRLFDVTTCKSLGIVVNSTGEIPKGQKDVIGGEETQVHMEAMTVELFEKHQKAKRRGIDEDDEDEVAAKESASVAQKQEVQVKIILKAKGFEDFKLIVKPVSSILFNSSTCLFIDYL